MTNMLRTVARRVMIFPPDLPLPSVTKIFADLLTQTPEPPYGPGMRKPLFVAIGGLVLISVGVGWCGAALDWDWGDVPTWVQSAATVAALGAAGIGAYFAYGQLGMLRDQVKLQDKALTLQMDQMREDREESSRHLAQELKLLQVAARRQAEQIIVKPTMRSVYFENAPYHGMLALSVDNRSPRPIRDVAARLDMKPYSRLPYGFCGRDIKELAAINRLPLLSASVIRGDEGVDLVFPVQLLQSAQNDFASYTLWNIAPNKRIADPALPGDVIADPKIEFVIRFTDDALQHWELTGDMSLTQIADRNDW